MFRSLCLMCLLFAPGSALAQTAAPAAEPEKPSEPLDVIQISAENRVTIRVGNGAGSEILLRCARVQVEAADGAFVLQCEDAQLTVPERNLRLEASSLEYHSESRQLRLSGMVTVTGGGTEAGGPTYEMRAERVSWDLDGWLRAEGQLRVDLDSLPTPSEHLPR